VKGIEDGAMVAKSSANARVSLTFQRALMSYYTGEIDAGNLKIVR
jgi:hypothetical protein